MRPIAKFGLVVAGYVGAFLVAYAAVLVYTALSNVPDDQASGGMQAFGDSLFFLGVFSVAAVPATAGAFYFLKSHPLFWRVFTVASCATAFTGLAAFVVYIMARRVPLDSVLHMWSALAVLRILAAPLCALLFLLSSFFAPHRVMRLALFAAAAVEAVAFAGVALIWILGA